MMMTMITIKLMTSYTTTEMIECDRQGSDKKDMKSFSGFENSKKKRRFGTSGERK